MWVIGYILYPENEYEESINIPVAAEKFFNKYWLPAAEELGLKWIPTFSAGMDILKEDVPDVLFELSQIKEWAKENLKLSDDDKEYMISRIELMEKQIPESFKRDNAVLFIG